MFARFDENPAMTLRVIKETKRYRRTDGQTDGRTDGRTDNVKTVYPLQTKFAGGIIKFHRQTRHACVDPDDSKGGGGLLLEGSSYQFFFLAINDNL